jgi:predicted lipoprotein
MIKRLAMGWLCLLALSAISVQAQGVDYQQILQNITDTVIIPNNQTFYDSSLILESTTQAFSENPTLDTLIEVQDAWKATMLAWQPVSVIGFREVMQYNNRVNKAPTKTKFIEDFIGGDKVLDVDFIGSIGSNSVGLPAMEYLLFSPDGDNQAMLNALTGETRRMQYLVALSQGLQVTAGELRLFWLPEGGNYAQIFVNAENDGGDVQASMNALANEIVATLEVMAKVRVGTPLGVDSENPRPQEAESYLSGLSFASMQATLTTVQAMFNGKDGVGFDDYLAEIAQETLASDINAQFDATIASMATISLPLSQAVMDSSSDVRAVYDNIKVLIRYFKADIAQQMGITITFNDADGD